jgi:hypothetical protein
MDRIYCIKCRSHTENVDERREQITSKGKPRLVMKALCATCSKKKNKFIKTEKSKTVSQEEYDQLVVKLNELQNTINQFDEKDLK